MVLSDSISSAGGPFGFAALTLSHLPQLLRGLGHLSCGLLVIIVEIAIDDREVQQLLGVVLIVSE